MKKRLLSCIVCVLTILTCSSFTTYATTQNDAPLTRMEFICALYREDLNNGGRSRYFEDTSLSPDPAMPLQYASYVYYFHDVPVGAENHHIISWAYKCNLVSGCNYNFNPNHLITREEASVILRQYSVYLGYGANSDQSELCKYSDSSLISEWAKDAMSWALSNNIIHSLSDGCANPTAAVTLTDLLNSLDKLNQHIKNASINRGNFTYLLYDAYLRTEPCIQRQPDSDKPDDPGGPGSYHPMYDVRLGTQYALSVLFAREALHAAIGIFHPGYSISNEEAATFFWRYSQFVGTYESVPNENAIIIQDSDSISDWSKDAVIWAIHNRIMAVDNAGNFKPQNTMSVQTASILIEQLVSLPKTA